MRRGSGVFLFLWGFCLWTGGLAVAGAPASALDARLTEAVDLAAAALDSAAEVSGPLPLRWWQVPKEVRRNVRLAYPYRLYRDWAKEDSFYTVRVISADYEFAYFDSTGEWVRARRPLRLSELPYRTYLFIKEEFKAFRFIVGYRLQERDDLARYYVELEHKRIHSLKTYLEFDFFGTLTRLDGQPVGGEPEESAEAQEEWARLYAEVYDPEAEEAAYAAAEVVEVVADTLITNAALGADTAVAHVADTEVVMDTMPLAADTLIAALDTVPGVDVAIADTMVAAIADAEEAEEVADTLPLVADTMSEIEAVVADTMAVAVDTVADTLSLVADTMVEIEAVVADTMAVAVDTVADTLPLVADTMSEIEAVVADTMAVAVDTVADTITSLCPDIVEKNFRKRFPGGRDAIWQKQDTLYVVSFNQYGKSVMAAFRGDGFQIYTAYGMERKEFPLPIDNYLKASAKGMKLEEGRRVAYEAKYRRLFPASERPKDYYYVIMSRKQPKGKQRQYIRFVFNQNAQFESQSNQDVYQSGK